MNCPAKFFRSNTSFVWFIFFSWSCLFATICYPGIPSADYLFQKSQIASELTDWHPLFFILLFKALGSVAGNHSDEIIYLLQVFAFYFTCSWILTGVFAEIDPIPYWAPAVIVLFYPIWYLIMVLVKDSFFLSFGLLTLFQLWKLSCRLSFFNILLASVLGMLCISTRHNAIVTIALLGSLLAFQSQIPSGRKRFLVVFGCTLLIALGGNKLTEYVLSIKKTNIVALGEMYEIAGICSKMDRASLNNFVSETHFNLYLTQLSSSQYNYKDCSDYMFFGYAPLISPEKAMGTEHTTKTLLLLILHHPLAWVEFKSDVFLQLLGIYRYDFTWSDISINNRSKLSSVFVDLLNIFGHKAVFANSTDLLGRTNFFTLFSTTYGLCGIASLLLTVAIIFGSNQQAIKINLVFFWGAFTFLLPYLIITPGIAYRYISPAHVSWLFSIIISIHISIVEFKNGIFLDRKILGAFN